MKQNSAERLNNFIELHVQFRSTEGDCLFWMQQTLTDKRGKTTKRKQRTNSILQIIVVNY